MTLATRLRHQVNSHAAWDCDETRIAAHYAVEGTDNGLVLTTWISHEQAEDADVIAQALVRLDAHAQIAADDPATWLQVEREFAKREREWVYGTGGQTPIGIMSIND